MRRHFVLLALAVSLVAIAALAGCTSSTGQQDGTSSDGTTITEKNLTFSPSTLTVNVGDTVTFTNEDSATHNVKIDGQELGQQTEGQSVTWTATKTGTFPYSCTNHPSMTGEIVVK